jgi:acyl-CoA oxidase
MRWSKVTSDGKYSQPPMPQILYMPMLNGRIEVAEQSMYDLQRALTIAIRYACVRRQFPKSEKDPAVEQQIIDYQTHQYRLLPYLATSYAMRFACMRMVKQYHVVLEELKEGKVESDLMDLHATTAAMKASCTWIAYSGTDACRLSLGGHGYSQYAGLAQLLGDLGVMTIWEGENYVLIQQTSRYLLKCIQQVVSQSGKKLTSSVAYLNNLKSIIGRKCTVKSMDEYLDSHVQLEMFQFKSANLLWNTAKRMKSETERLKSEDEAWNNCLVDLIACAKAHIHCYVLETFISKIEEQTDPSLRSILKLLCDLYALQTLDEDVRVLLECDYMNGTQSHSLSEQVRILMKQVRQQSVPLVDAFNYTDALVNSPFGRYDGDMYTHYFERVKRNPVNTMGVMPYYKEILHPHLKQEYSNKYNNIV